MVMHLQYNGCRDGLPLPNVSPMIPIPSLICTFVNGMGLRMGNGISPCFSEYGRPSINPFHFQRKVCFLTFLILCIPLLGHCSYCGLWNGDRQAQCSICDPSQHQQVDGELLPGEWEGREEWGPGALYCVLQGC